ncbi:MAG TPA: hypothetical protein H9894_09345 [Candidatus Desulfovibrio intestinipullorum]|uniref:Uncharacterized protein n=1 Tax=Candidatus Desulfovibrio intestinipullorum TaxID=2838536 RepID=A0A9D1PY04_9BACT|nr:hypothetical protein [Candidatus Desulfovibrio intestinipullorum]
MIIWILAAVVGLLVIGYLVLGRYVLRLDSKREVLHLYENVEWNTEAVEYVRRQVRELKWSIISWVAGLMLVQTVVIFLAIIYILENTGN